MGEVAPYVSRGQNKPQTSYAEAAASIGDLTDVRIFNNQLLVAIYMRPEKTQGGLYLPDKTRDEDKWQGSAGFVLKKGPLAFKHVDFEGQNIEPGEVVVYRTSDGLPKDINGVHCRIIEDVQVKMVVPNPDMVW